MKFPTLCLSLVVAMLVSAIADAQLFRRNVERTRTVVQSCPSGFCPQANVTRSVQVNRSAGHWSFPGTISSHLQNTHRVSTVGLTREQMLELHDSLHEGRTTTVIVKPTVVQPATQTFTPTKAPELPKPTSSEVTFGLDDIYSTKVEIPKYVLAQVEEPAEVVEDPFRKSLIKAISDARKKGTINLRDAVKLRVATLSPAFMERAQELAVTQVAFSGIESENVPMDADGMVQVEGINWEGLALFLEKLIPLILSLLKAFGV